MKRVLLVELLAVVPFALLAATLPDPTVALTRIDVLLAFRLLMLLWILAHVVVIVQRFLGDLQSLRDYLVEIESVWPEAAGAAVTGGRILRWSSWRVAGHVLRQGWMTAFLLAAVAGGNVLAWLILSGRVDL